MAFPGKRKVIFLHGCFWHSHECPKGRPPKSGLPYWQPKLAANRARDAMISEKLAELGWSTMTVWQCELKDVGALEKRVFDFLR